MRLTWDILLKGILPAGIRAGYPVAILSARRRMKFGFPFNLIHQVSFLRLPQDKKLRLPEMNPNGVMKPQSIQYPPGMEPKHGISEDLGPHAGKTIMKRRFESYEATGVSDWSYNRNL